MITNCSYKNKLNRGFETPFSFNHNQKEYEIRMIILFDQGLASRKRHALNNRVEKTRQAFADLDARLNAYRLKSKEAIEKACDAVLRKYQTADFFSYIISNEPIVTYKNKKRGCPAKGEKQEQIDIVKDFFYLLRDHISSIALSVQFVLQKLNLFSFPMPF